MSVAITAIRWKYNEKKDGTNPIKIRVTHKSESKYYPVIFQGQSLSLTSDQWNLVSKGDKLPNALKIVRSQITKSEATAAAVCDKITANGKKPFSFSRFEQEFRPTAPRTFFQFFDEYLRFLMTEGRVGSYSTYRCARISLFKFLGKDIQTYELTPSILRSYEAYLLKPREDGGKRPVSRNTVAIYMRTIKLIFNYASDVDPSLEEFYPFAKRRNQKNKYQIRTASGSKGQALSLPELRKFISSAVEPGSGEWEAKQLWLFSLFCQGMNFRDIAMLKVKDCQHDHIRFIRHKTKNTELHEQPIIVPITPPIREILEGLATGRQSEDYLFNILTPQMGPIDIKKAINNKIRTTNERLAGICQRIGLPKISTYWARHSYATLLRDNGESVETIREMLGHSSTKTTESYLKKIEISRSERINRNLQDLIFKNIDNRRQPLTINDNDENIVVQELAIPVYG